MSLSLSGLVAMPGLSLAGPGVTWQGDVVIRVGPEKVLHARLRTLGDQLEGALLEQAVGLRRPLLVLAQVLFPGGHHVCLDKALGIGAVLEQPPALATRAPPGAADRLHRLAERVGALGWHAVLHLHQHRAVTGVG